MLRKLLLTLGATGVLLTGGALVGAQSDFDEDGYDLDCDGTEIENGIPVVIRQMRSGFTYTATAVGVDGFDPLIAVLDENGNGLCNDDDAVAAEYSANLPTVDADNSNRSAQVRFSQNSGDGFEDVTLVVGGYDGSTGEFVVILEGMAVTGADNAGDPFSVLVTPDMVDSGVGLTAYMLTRGQSGVDPLLFLADADLDPLEDDDGNPVACDDAGNSELCWGESVALDGYSVTIDTGTLPGWEYDAMISLDISNVDLDNDPDENYFNYVMTSYNRQSEGQYLIVFHMSTGD